jgi:hypothetical protein
MNQAQRAARPQWLHDAAAGGPSTSPAPTDYPPLAAVKTVEGERSEQAFAAMLAAYRPSGGVAHGDDLARLLEDYRSGDFVSLARLLVVGEIFSFEFRNAVWVPMFQFDLSDLSTKRAPRQVRAELAPKFDGWALALWFSLPNSWLNGRRPVDLLDANVSAVSQAARADKFIAARLTRRLNSAGGRHPAAPRQQVAADRSDPWIDFKSLHHAVVWIDHHSAQILHFDADSVQAQKITAHSHHSRDHSRDHGSGARSEHDFFAEVCNELSGIAEILVTGSHQAQSDFRPYVDKHRVKAGRHIVGWEIADHPTEGQLIAFARRHFVRR